MGVNATTHILFDHNNDGIITGTGWVKGEDGLLVLDHNGNGVIDNGSELFGDSTTVNGVNATDGFSALRAEDTNKNGTFDAGDTNFTNVRVWQDKNQDGISQTNELHTLSELGIKSINLASTATSGWLEGATQTATGTFTRYARVRGSAGFTRSLHPLSRINEHYAKLAMTQRLREQGQTDALSEIKVHLETLEKERSLNRDRIQNGYEAQKVILQHTRASGCTLW